MAAVGHTQTTNPPATGSTTSRWVHTKRDSMLHFEPASGFDTVNDAVQWHNTTTHIVVALEPTSATPPVTITDAPIGTTPATAINLPLT